MLPVATSIGIPKQAVPAATGKDLNMTPELMALARVQCMLALTEALWNWIPYSGVEFQLCER